MQDKSIVENIDPWSGEAFINRVADNRETAFNELVAEYRNEIFDLCLRISGNRTEAEDLSQETFIKAYENLKRFRGDAKPKTWLYRIAINQSISLKRRFKRWRMIRSDDGSDFPIIDDLNTESPELETELKDLAKFAHDGLQDLPDRQRVAVILRIVKEMSYEEVARTMNTSVGGAKANVHQGLAKLRKALEEENE